MVLHFGTNDLKSKLNTIENNTHIIKEIKHSCPETKIIINSITYRGDDVNLNKKIDQIIQEMSRLCNEKNNDFISNDNITNEYLNGSKLHLKKKGDTELAKNIITHLKSI